MMEPMVRSAGAGRGYAAGEARRRAGNRGRLNRVRLTGVAISTDIAIRPRRADGSFYRRSRRLGREETRVLNFITNFKLQLFTIQARGVQNFRCSSAETIRIGLFTSPLAWCEVYCDQCVCMSLCMYVCGLPARISQKSSPNFKKFSVRLTVGWVLV